MANKEVFSKPVANKIVSLSPQEKLAQLAATGCFNDTFYVSAVSQVEELVKLTNQCEPEFIADLAIYSRQKSFMKDMPAFLCASLTVRGDAGRKALDRAFPEACDTGKTVKNFVQIIRSGVLGRKSLGTMPKRLVRHWMNRLSDEELFRNNVGNAPSLTDLIKMVHPKPQSISRRNLIAYLLGKEYEFDSLPEAVKAFENFKKTKEGDPPRVDFRLLTSLDLTADHWKTIARNASWTETRKNLNTFSRHDVFKDPEMVSLVANKLKNPELIKRSKCFPYELMAAFINVNDDIPTEIKNALQDAMEIAVENTIIYNSKIYVCIDTSGSMSSPITGSRKGATSKIRCIDVAALIGSVILRKNNQAVLLPFDTQVHSASFINARDSIMTNAIKLAELGGGGTDCSAPLALLNKQKAEGALIIYVSDNESWSDKGIYYNNETTSMTEEWKKFKARSPGSKLVCIDITPNATIQASNREDVLNIGGFSDNVFEAIVKFCAHKTSWIETIKN